MAITVRGSIDTQGMSLDTLGGIAEDCLKAAAKSTNAVKKKKWFGLAASDARIPDCLKTMVKWADTGIIYFERPRKPVQASMAASPLHSGTRNKLFAKDYHTSSGIRIQIHPRWNSGSAVDGDRLIAILHEMTHWIIHTLDVADTDVLDTCYDRIKGQLPTKYLKSGKVYYGMINAKRLARKDGGKAAILNAENWAYFIAEFRTSMHAIRFLSSNQETARTKNKWTVDFNAKDAVSVGPFV